MQALYICDVKLRSDSTCRINHLCIDRQPALRLASHDVLALAIGPTAQFRFSFICRLEFERSNLRRKKI